MSSGRGNARRRRKGIPEEHEEHVNHERWLVSYADMLTLLFVLFVVLFSMSNIDQKKFAELAAGPLGGFGPQSVAFQGQTSNLEGSGAAAQVVEIDPGANPGDGSTGTQHLSKAQQAAVDRAVQAQSRAKASQDAQAATKEAENLKEVERKIADALQTAKLLD